MALKVLIVDDDPDMAELTCEVLESHGMAAHSVAAVPDALDHIAAHDVDVVITDVLLGTGAEGNGLDLCKELASKYPDVAVVVLSGDETSREPAMRLGAKAFFLKPVALSSMVDTIRAFGSSG